MYSQITSNKIKSVFLIIFFVILTIILGSAVDLSLGGGGFIILLSLAYAIISALIGYYAGDKVALRSAGAKLVAKDDAPELWRTIENLCIANGQPMPKIYLIDDPSPNAFATGRTPKTSSIAFTTGLLEKLNKTEFEGVASHELSHIKNYDIRVMTIVVVLVGFVAAMSDIFIRISRRRSGNSRDGSGALLLIGLIAVILAPIIASLIKLATSRRREYLADASGALLTRYPEGLASALQKISAYEQPMRRASSATAHLYIASPFGKQNWFTRMFSTHPPIEERIKALRQMGVTP